MLGFPGVAHTDPDYLRRLRLSTLLGGGMSSRLFQEVREKRGLVYSDPLLQPVLSPTAGSSASMPAPARTRRPRLVPVIAEELARSRDGARRRGAGRARAQMKAGLLMSLESTGCARRADGAAAYPFGRPLTVAEIVAEIDAVDRGGLAGVAERLTRAPAAFVASGPLGRLAPYGELARSLG